MQSHRLQCVSKTSASIRCYRQKNTRLLEKVPNNAAHFIHQKYDWSTSVIASNTDIKLPTLQQCRNTSDLIMWYKIHFSLVSIHFPLVVLLSPRVLKFHHELSYSQVQHWKKCFEYSYYVRTIPLLNSLPNLPTSATSINNFQHLVAIYCVSQQP